MGLGKKIGNSFKNLGKKTSNAVHTVGRKIDTAANTVIKKTGAVSNALRVGSRILDQTVGIASAIGGNVPVVGSILQAAKEGSHQLRRGAKYVDDARDKVAQRKQDAIARLALEKNNIRKRIENAAAANASGHGNFV